MCDNFVCSFVCLLELTELWQQVQELTAALKDQKNIQNSLREQVLMDLKHQESVRQLAFTEIASSVVQLPGSTLILEAAAAKM
jgi:hypothetical protein